MVALPRPPVRLTVDTFFAWAESLRVLWRQFLPDPTWRAFAVTIVLAVFYFVLVWSIERANRVRTDHYRQRGFAHDLLFYFYSKGGLPKLVLPTALMVAVHDRLSFLDLRLVEGLPYPVQLLCWVMVGDFLNYWVHRAKHHFRFLWAFHATHHSQVHLNFATYARAHPFENFIGQFMRVFIMLLMGADPVSFFLVYLLLDALGELTHTQIPWRFGPLYYIFVTPPFHSFHHSVDPAHHDRNYASVFSFWDYLFGTAVPAGSPRPTRFGIPEMRGDSLTDALFGPFRLLYQYYLKPGRSG
jgi:sterol desaturase/sphingolipid hydroxylase (fatty acid hydroxylase superfamily)